MESLEAELERARALDVATLADAIESIGFECTRCGGCCKGMADEPHTATVFPDEIRDLQDGAAEAADGDESGDSDGSVDGGSEDDGGTGDGDGSGDDGGNGDGAGSERGDGSENGDGGGSGEYDWRDVARPMPYGLSEGKDGLEGETFEWALQTDACGDCQFYEEAGEASSSDGSDAEIDVDAGDQPGDGYCTVHEDRPLICRTYPFSVALGGTSQPMGEAVDEEGMVRAHECEGLGREIDRGDAVELAEALRERAIRELEEAISVRDSYEPVPTGAGEIVVHDSEGPKTPDGRPIE